MSGQRILVVDDDRGLRELLAEYLSSRGLEVLLATCGEEGLEVVKRGGVDLVVMDVMMPGIDGFEATRRLRAFSSVPVIMLTARGDDMDRIVGLELGADDYMPKPFNPRELLARIQAVLRRSQPQEPEQQLLRVSELEIDLDRRTVTFAGSAVDLTTTEFEILRTLVAGAGRVIPRERLMELARGDGWAAFDRSVDVHISHIRKKLNDDPKRPVYIKTVRGVGYTVPRTPR